MSPSHNVTGVVPRLLVTSMDRRLERLRPESAMRVLWLHLRTFLVVGTFCVCACADSTAPPDPALRAFTGTFVLQSVDGASVPVLRFDYSTIRGYLTADTLTADGLGRYTRVIITQIDSVGRAYSTTQRAAFAGIYAVRGDTLDFPVQCPPGALCVRPQVGWRTADGGLVIAFPFTPGFQDVSLFARVR